MPAAAAGILAVFAAAYLIFFRETTPPTIRDDLIAVFPLENRTGDASLDHLGMLAANKLAKGLTRVGGLSVVPTSSAELAVRRAPEGTPAHEIAVGLEAFVAISGYYIKQAENLVFRVEVVQARTGEHIASLESPFGPASSPTILLDSLQQRLTTPAVLALAGVDINALLQLPSYEVALVFARGSALFQAGDWAGAASQHLEAYRLDTTFISPLLSAMVAYANMGSFGLAWTRCLRS